MSEKEAPRVIVASEELLSRVRKTMSKGSQMQPQATFDVAPFVPQLDESMGIDSATGSFEPPLSPVRPPPRDNQNYQYFMKNKQETGTSEVYMGSSQVTPPDSPGRSSHAISRYQTARRNNQIENPDSEIPEIETFDLVSRPVVYREKTEKNNLTCTANSFPEDIEPQQTPLAGGRDISAEGFSVSDNNLLVKKCNQKRLANRLIWTPTGAQDFFGADGYLRNDAPQVMPTLPEPHLEMRVKKDDVLKNPTPTEKDLLEYNPAAIWGVEDIDVARVISIEVHKVEFLSHTLSSLEDLYCNRIRQLYNALMKDADAPMAKYYKDRIKTWREEINQLDESPQSLEKEKELLKQIIEAFLMHRREVVTRRCLFDLRENRSRGHVLEGLAVALANIDDFLAIIRAAPTPDVAKAGLMGRGWNSALVGELLDRAGEHKNDYRPEGLDPLYGRRPDGLYYLSETQADSILQMRLQRLTGLEQDKIIQEYKSVVDTIADLLDILDKPDRVRQIIEDDLIEIKNEYGDDRRSEIDPTGDPNFNPRDLIPRREMVVTMTRDGYIKSQQLSDYQAQRRGGQGKKAATMKEGDMIDQLFIANSHDRVLFFSNFGRMYCLDVYSLPEGSRNSKGRPIINSLPLTDSERITVALPIEQFDDKHFVFMATASAVVKKVRLSDFANVRKAGLIAVNLDEGDHLIGAAITDGAHDVMLFSDAGKAVRFSEEDVRAMGRAARGVRGMMLKDGQQVISLLVIDDENKTVLTVTENGYGKRTSVSEYTRHGRGAQGMIAIQTSERNGKVVAATLVNENDEIMLITTGGVLIRTRVSEIREMGRATQGVTLIAVEEGTKLSGLQRILESDIDDASENA